MVLRLVLLAALLLTIQPFLSARGQVVVAASIPTVTAISPPSGPTGGGTTVTITGTNFTGATAVTFGGTNARSFSAS